MKRQNELSLVGSDEDNVMENTRVEMKYWCNDKYHNCVMMEQATTNTPARFVFPSSLQLVMKLQPNVRVCLTPRSTLMRPKKQEIRAQLIEVIKQTLNLLLLLIFPVISSHRPLKLNPKRGLFF